MPAYTTPSLPGLRFFAATVPVSVSAPAGPVTAEALSAAGVPIVQAGGR